ncbi:MAG: hypothetical protein HOV79_33470 [Hamadaea sp.]|nr:hypothetical protein [Hamadaea sp.]
MTRRRKLGLSAALGAVLSVVLIAAPAPAAQSSGDPAATAAVAELARTGQAVVPADFVHVMGYTPVTARLSDGQVRTVNPEGSCSVPGEGRPFTFSTACQAHDFGYDLLRYAQRQGEPLADDARAAVDSRLAADLHSECAQTVTGSEYAACTATADVFAAGVAFNSWRQMSGPPIDSSGLPRTGGLVLLGLVLLLAPARWARRAARRWAWTSRLVASPVRSPVSA